MKLDYKRINPWFFLIGTALCICVCGLNAVIVDAAKDAFLLVLFFSEIFCTVFFYRFNNGLIALFRGRFAMPSKKDNKFVDYSKSRVENTDEMKQAVAYGKKSLIMYKLNSREVLQIYRKGDRLVVHKCFPEKEQNELIYDFENAALSKTDWFIPISEINSITFGISKTNYDLPIFSISRKKKNYRFIGYFEPVTKELLTGFFRDICKIKTRNGEKAAKESAFKIERKKFLYNLLHLLTAFVAPSMNYVLLIGETGKVRIIGSVYMISTLVILLICLLIVILNKNKLILEYEDKKDSTRELFLEFVIINLALFIAVDSTIIVNTGYFLMVTALIFAVLTYIYFITNPVKKPEKDEKRDNRIVRIAMVCITVAVIGVSSANLIFGANYVIPVKTTTEQYAVKDVEADSENEDVFYVTVNIEGQNRTIDISKKTLEKNSSFIKAERTKGIFGIEYIKAE